MTTLSARLAAITGSDALKKSHNVVPEGRKSTATRTNDCNKTSSTVSLLNKKREEITDDLKKAAESRTLNVPNGTSTAVL